MLDLFDYTKTILLTIIAGTLILSIIQSSSGVQYAANPAKPSGLLSIQSDILQGFGPGILKFNKDLGDDSSCDGVTPKPETKIVERNKDSLLNIDEKPGYFFIVLGQLNATSYQYLQIGLQRDNDLTGQVTNPSYIIDLKNQGKPLMGGLYQGYPNFVVVLESDKDTSTYPEENNKNYLEGTSKNVTYQSDRLGPGEYDSHAILFQSDTPDWINHDVCAISLHWQFSVNDKGVITSSQPKAEKGMLSDVTKEFPPLQQHKKGVNIGDIECRHGLQLIAKAKGGLPACVKPESATKLVSRGWAMKITNSTIEGIKLDCTKPLGLQMLEIEISINQTKAIALAYTSQEFLSKSNQYGSSLHFNTIFNGWIIGDPCNIVWKSVNVIFSGNNQNGDPRNIQVTEDVNLTKVLDVTDYASGFEDDFYDDEEDEEDWE